MPQNLSHTVTMTTTDLQAAIDNATNGGAYGTNLNPDKIVLIRTTDGTHPLTQVNLGTDQHRLVADPTMTWIDPRTDLIAANDRMTTIRDLQQAIAGADDTGIQIEAGPNPGALRAVAVSFHRGEFVLILHDGTADN